MFYARQSLPLLRLRDIQAWTNRIYVNTWKNNPQNVYNLAAIAVALVIVFVALRLGVTYLKYESTA
jgi:hypothetical protein